MAKDYFIFECEGHIIPNEAWARPAYLPNYAKWMQSLGGCLRGVTNKTMEEVMLHKPADLPITQPEAFIWLMDKAGCDVATCIPERFYNITDGEHPLVSNAMAIEYVTKFPDRLILAPNFHPSHRGVDKVIAEMEVLAKTNNCKIFKFYPPDELWPMNDRRYWPFYEKAQELGMIMEVHTGMGYVYGASTVNSMPIHLEEICKDFFDLKVVAFHFGWPWNDVLNVLAGCFPNLYISVSYVNHTINWKPRMFAKLLGDAIQWATVDKVIWGEDGMPSAETIEAFKNFQFSEGLQEDYGYQPLTEEDKAKIFGINLANLLGIEPTKREKTYK